jgi:signal peptidase II
LIGAVVDFLDFHAFGTHWPAFNMADTTIFLGAAGLIFESFFSIDEAA